MSDKNWDIYFHNICKAVSSNCKCLSRQIGAILVRDKSIVSTGYNGPPRGVIPCDERWFVDENMKKKAGFEKMTIGEFNSLYKSKLEGVCPRYVDEMGFKSGEGLEWCPAGHAEENAILNAARNGIKTKGLKMYMDCQIPCKNCLIKIINSGIEEIIVTGFKYYDISSEYLLKESGLRVRVYNHLKENN